MRAPPLPSTMHAAVLYGPEDVRWEQVPVPRPGPGEVVARVAAASADFTDRKVYRRGRHPMIQVPGLFGHEWAGTIAAVGPEVDPRWRPGLRVVAANSAPCLADDAAGPCRFCGRGRENLCERLQYNNGAFAAFIRVPARLVRANLHAVPDGVALEHAALAEPLACVLHGARRLPLAPGDRVAVLGAGPIGLLFVAALRDAHGPRLRLAALDHHDDRLALARELGADLALNTAAEGPARHLKAAWGDEGVDVAVEAVGTVGAHREALALLRRGGTLVSFGGVAPGEELAVDIGRMHYEELAFLPVYHHTPRDVTAAVAAIAAGRIPVGRLITHRIPLKELSRALTLIAHRQCLRPVLIPEHEVREAAHALD
ncbi:MAG TPA: zinc-binding dehydrogenase [Candidatus Methylomirabilis sp.]